MRKRKASEKTIILDEQTLAALEKGIESGKSGRRWTLDEAIEFARARRKEWTKLPDDKTA